MKKIIELLEIGDLEKSILLRLRDKLSDIFNSFDMSVKIAREQIQLENTEYNSKRRQYDADKILKRIIRDTRNHKSFRILGVIDKDIFSEPLNFVFGIAQKPIKKFSGVPVVSLISITRLREQFYSKPDNNEIFELRILKEAIHELGHTLSLEHCEKSCIMRFSNSLMDTDNKPAHFCESCRNKGIHFL
ncbi:MAG: archaemetzincin family Zn-dependent metalloprotease [Candidatus Hodarchaeota archaeon]